MNYPNTPASSLSHQPAADSAVLFYDLVSIPAFVYNFAEDRYLWISRSLDPFIDSRKFLSTGWKAWSENVHPDDQERFQSAYAELRKLASCLRGQSAPALNAIAFRLSKGPGHWIQTILKADVVGYDPSGHACCIFGLLIPGDEVQEPEPGTVTVGIHSNGNITGREMEVLGLLRKGKSSREISEGLSISFHTVESYRKRLLQKFNVRNTPELIAKAGTRFAWYAS